MSVERGFKHYFLLYMQLMEMNWKEELNAA